MLNNIYPPSRTIPYTPSSALIKLEKTINAYISKNPLQLQISVSARIFNAFLKQIPRDKRAYYSKHGIPYGIHGLYTLILKK